MMIASSLEVPADAFLDDGAAIFLGARGRAIARHRANTHYTRPLVEYQHVIVEVAAFL